MCQNPGAGPIEGDPAVTHVDDHRTVTLAVVSAIASVTDTEPTALEPLYETIDTDALERIVGDSGAEPDASLQLSFVTNGCTVILYGDGRIVASSTVDVER